MSKQDPPKYVIDSGPFGGTYSYNAVVGSGAPESRPPHERVWSEIPLEYCLPSPEIEDAVKEVECILYYLKRILTPTPLPDDDLQLMSDYLLSLETRYDLTAHVLKQTAAVTRISTVSRILLKDDRYNFKLRAIALEKHWRSIESLIRKGTPKEMVLDRSIAPVKTELPDDKPAGWKLDLGETRAAEAQRQLELLKMEKSRCIKYWTTVKRPKPIGWIPVDGEAWKKVSRTDLENGDLYFSPYFKPMWESYGMAQMDIAFWTDPDNTPEEEAEYQTYAAEKRKLAMLSLEMMKARKDILYPARELWSQQGPELIMLPEHKPRGHKSHVSTANSSASASHNGSQSMAELVDASVVILGGTHQIEHGKKHTRVARLWFDYDGETIYNVANKCWEARAKEDGHLGLGTCHKYESRFSVHKKCPTSRGRK